MRYIDEEDRKLAQMLKQAAHDPGENPWFTRRVLNKLPEPKPRGGTWSSVAVYAFALVACALCGLWLLRNQDFTVITVRDVLHLAIMGIVGIVVLWQGVATFLRLAD